MKPPLNDKQRAALKLGGVKPVTKETFIDQKTRNVTHIPTGLKLPGYFSRLRDAKAYAEALFPLTDWLTLTQDNATERFTPIKPTILNLMKEHGI